MDAILNFLHALGLIAIVIALFNVIIFVHELGHFLAARWRGLRVDRFQIWFGKPIWKKEHNGVQYGLGWIPAGGFVALPQMAPMEAIEGSNRDEDDEPLPPIKPWDKEFSVKEAILLFDGKFHEEDEDEDELLANNNDEEENTEKMNQTILVGRVDDLSGGQNKLNEFE